ncbi:GtrA family protein [Herbaspirillum rhizosphaerae]|uniref:GtrA family protein n=1 Tax=Herbaspirillum rhizosphaerae TaxID=346179 RepID=UPI00067D3AFA|nr:GtrA family protein [Herbaspirillum rhizosphaerae]
MVRQLFRFGLAGVAGFVVDTVVLYLMLFLGLGFYLGRLVSFFCAVWVTWHINRNYSFAPGQKTPPSWQEWWRYLLAMSLGGAVNYLAYSASLQMSDVIRAHPVYAVAVGSLAGMAVNFISAKWWVFKR